MWMRQFVCCVTEGRYLHVLQYCGYYNFCFVKNICEKGKKNMVVCLLMQYLLDVFIFLKLVKN